jgi:beta-lactamase regulating signal transducer with metallopeptidase domain
MTIGASLVLIAIGAVLKFAITDNVKDVDLGTIGVILMVIGVVGLLLGLALTMSRRRTDIISRPGRTTYVEPNDPLDPRL